MKLGFGVFMISLLASPAQAQSLGPLEQAIRAAGYQLYNPPRENWGPGFVFTGEVVSGRIKNPREICPNLYADVEAPRSTKVLFPDFQASDSFSFGLAIKFIKGILGLDVDVGKVESERKISVKWQNLQETSYSDVDKWLESGEARPIASRCRAAIEDLKGKDQFKDRVFVIVRAVAPELLIYEFDSALSGQAGASAEVWQQGSAKIEGKGEIKNQTRLELKQRLYVGYAPPMKLQEWVPTGLVSGEVIKVRGETTNLGID